jgi:predicted dehydrogenase
MFMRFLAAVLLAMSLAASAETNAIIRLMTLAPAHFHAALLQKEMPPGVAPKVDVFATHGADLDAHLKRIEQFNTRSNNPTHWREIIHTNENPLAQMLAERPGNVVVMSGKNRGKIEALEKIVGAKLNVLADKPWIIEPEDFAKLAATLDAADDNGVIAYDGMTQRFEVSCQLPRELVNDAEIFGQLDNGSATQPAVELESVHYLLKEVAGVPLLRPAWYFDIAQQGEALADIGTHLVDLVQWTLFPEQAIDFRKEIKLTAASRWPTKISLAQYQRVTGEKEFPDFLHDSIHDGALAYFGNDSLTYQLRGTFVKLTVKWGYEAPAGSKDSELAVFSGTKSRVEVRQGKEENFVPEVYVVPASAELKTEIAAALTNKLAALQKKFPGLAMRPHADGFRLVIPDALRIGHEAHFALLARRFLDYVRDPKSLPAWEKPNMIAKYFVTTEGVKLARKNSANSK